MIKIILIADDMTNAYISHTVEVLSGIFGIFSVCYKNVVQVPKSYCYKKRTTMWLHLRLGMKKKPETKPYNYDLQQKSFPFKWVSNNMVLYFQFSVCSWASVEFSQHVLQNPDTISPPPCCGTKWRNMTLIPRVLVLPWQLFYRDATSTILSANSTTWRRVYTEHTKLL